MNIAHRLEIYRKCHVIHEIYQPKKESVRRVQKAAISNMTRDELMFMMLLINEGYEPQEVISTTVTQRHLEGAFRHHGN